ncbi:MAG: GNAT family N-acetyltransferase [Kofleriaceae bacterium]
MSVRVERLRGAAVAPIVDALAALRIGVFRDYPYLYDGTVAYEARYLAGYAADPRALVVAAFDGDALVGASTALPARGHDPTIAEALAGGGLDPDRVYYFGESVLDARYRGRGLGHVFFDHREAVAAELGSPITAFCAVDRAVDDPRRPAGYRPLDELWRRRGYRRLDGVQASMSWREVGDPPTAPERAHTLTFWIRP